MFVDRQDEAVLTLGRIFLPDEVFSVRVSWVKASTAKLPFRNVFSASTMQCLAVPIDIPFDFDHFQNLVHFILLESDRDVTFPVWILLISASLSFSSSNVLVEKGGRGGR